MNEGPDPYPAADLGGGHSALPRFIPSGIAGTCAAEIARTDCFAIPLTTGVPSASR
jgi:hypothetical protein